MCREVLFLNYDGLSWEGASYVPGTRLPIPLLTSSACGWIDHPVLLARAVEAKNRISPGTHAVGPAAEAQALLRVINTELLVNNAGKKGADWIPNSVLKDAINAVHEQLGRLYDYYEEDISEKSKSIWDSEGSEIPTTRCGVWARWWEWQLQEVVYLERKGARVDG